MGLPFPKRRASTCSSGRCPPAACRSPRPLCRSTSRRRRRMTTTRQRRRPSSGGDSSSDKLLTYSFQPESLTGGSVLRARTGENLSLWEAGMIRSRWHGLGMLTLGAAYFGFYAPYSALANTLARGLLPGIGKPASGLELLPAVALGTIAGVTLFLCLT